MIFEKTRPVEQQNATHTGYFFLPLLCITNTVEIRTKCSKFWKFKHKILEATELEFLKTEENKCFVFTRVFFHRQVFLQVLSSFFSFLLCFVGSACFAEPLRPIYQVLRNAQHKQLCPVFFFLVSQAFQESSLNFWSECFLLFV